MNILLVEDDNDSLSCMSEFLRELGHFVVECENGEEALGCFSSGSFELVLTDIRMPGMTGIDLLKNLKTLNPDGDFDVVIITGHGDLESAIEAIRLGASDYFLKPINVEALAAMTERAAAKRVRRGKDRMLREQNAQDLKETADEIGCSFISSERYIASIEGVGEIGIFSDTIKELIQTSLRFHEDRDMPVLIQGETGTGKEVVARLVHHGLSDSKAPFVDINCAALTPSLFESELFGYEAGAYTGATTKGSKGKLDLASQGTLFLDEIGELSIDLQAKLLRVIQEKEYYRVGGLKKIKTDVRIICATNRDLKQSVERGLFRSDLFYRLNVGRFYLPPLRERREEIIPLARMFLREFALKRGKKFSGISDEASRILTSHHWTGNIRELRNTLEWAVFTYDNSELKPEHLGVITKSNSQEVPVSEDHRQSQAAGPSDLALPFNGFSLQEYVDNIVSRALELHNGNKAQTARYLGISRRSLYCRLEKMGQNQRLDEEVYL